MPKGFKSRVVTALLSGLLLVSCPTLALTIEETPSPGGAWPPPSPPKGRGRENQRSPRPLGGEGPGGEGVPTKMPMSNHASDSTLVPPPMRSTDIRSRRTVASPAAELPSTARRAPDMVSRREIFAAIQDELARLGVPGRQGLRPDDLNLQASVPRLRGDMGLQVKRIAFDPLRREVVFDLWAAQEPQYLPFQVTTRRDPRTLGLSVPYTSDLDGSDGAAQTNRAGSGRPALKPPILAKPGTPATLILLGQNVRITMSVVPLQPGSRGQTILVRDLATARVMTAEVVDAGLLRASL